MQEFDDDLISDKIEYNSYKLRYRRREGFSDKTLDSLCIINEIKYLFNMLSDELKNEVLNKPWLD